MPEEDVARPQLGLGVADGGGTVEAGGDEDDDERHIAQRAPAQEVEEVLGPEVAPAAAAPVEGVVGAGEDLGAMVM